MQCDMISTPVLDVCRLLILTSNILYTCDNDDSYDIEPVCCESCNTRCLSIWPLSVMQGLVYPQSFFGLLKGLLEFRHVYLITKSDIPPSANFLRLCQYTHIWYFGACKAPTFTIADPPIVYNCHTSTIIALVWVLAILNKQK